MYEFLTVSVLVYVNGHMLNSAIESIGLMFINLQGVLTIRSVRTLCAEEVG